MKTSLKFLTTAFALFAWGSCGSDRQISDWTRASDFIFQGTVKVLHTTTVDVDDAYGLTVVTVDKILDGAAVFQGLAGRDVTVKARNIDQLKEGRQYVFFGRNWVLGDEVGIVEVGHLPGGSQTAPTQEKIKTYRMEAADNDLAARLKSAERVVLAQVVETRPVETDESDMLSEHTPQWFVADLEVRETVKGDGDQKTLQVHFSNSDDVMWFRAPKLRKGQTAILLLQRPGPGLAPLVRPGMRYLLTDPQDLLGPDEMPRIKRLLRR
jgi:hypothetical protein